MIYSYQRTVHLADTDAAGVVYFAQLLHICHEAYETCLTQAGIHWQTLIQDQTLALPITHAEIDFFKPIHWGDRLLINLYPQAENTSQFTVHYQIYPLNPTPSLERPLAIAHTQHTSIKPRERQRCDLPEPIQQWLRNAPKRGDSKN